MERKNGSEGFIADKLDVFSFHKHDMINTPMVRG
jgi:hypothetical protein